MVKQIVRDIFFLGQPSKPATKADIQIGKDLQDTLQANREWCVGMAANMIGVRKNIIIVNMGFIDVVMFNPVIVSKHDMYETEEGCLSLDGVRKTTILGGHGRDDRFPGAGQDQGGGAVPNGVGSQVKGRVERLFEKSDRDHPVLELQGNGTG